MVCAKCAWNSENCIYFALFSLAQQPAICLRKIITNSQHFSFGASFKFVFQTANKRVSNATKWFTKIVSNIKISCMEIKLKLSMPGMLSEKILYIFKLVFIETRFYSKYFDTPKFYLSIQSKVANRFGTCSLTCIILYFQVRIIFEFQLVQYLRFTLEL